jgi:phenylacetate-CoA ligase
MKNDLAAFNTNDHTGASDERGREVALKLFHKAASRVPAYKDYLAEKGVDPEKIRTYDDFVKHVPIIDKENYISKYPLEKLCLDGDIFGSTVIATSSGSTGTPFFWPRSKSQIADETEVVSVFDNLEMNKKKTLFVMCFALGTWSAGTFVLEAATRYATLGNPVNIITSGIEKASALDAIKRLGASYEQVVIGAYPPFAKDIIQDGIDDGIDWKALNVKLIMGGEGFSEEWRDYVLELAGSESPYSHAANILGAADAGAPIAYETPLSIAVRRIYNENHAKMWQMFGVDVLPSIFQYNSSTRHIENVDSEHIITSDAGIPLVRYNLKDVGNIVSYEDMTAPIKDELTEVAKRENIDMSKWDMPFIYLHGRKNFTVTVYGVNVYPENIKAALIDLRARTVASGKFTMATMQDEHEDQVFCINVELARGVEATPEIQTTIECVVNEKLIEKNSEYHKLHDAVGEKVLPQIKLVEYGDKNYFAPGGKHRWVAKKEA